MVPDQTVCTLSKGPIVYTKTAGSSGTAVFTGLEQGTWNLSCTNGTSHGQSSVEIITDYNATVSLSGPAIFDVNNRDKYLDLTGEWLAQLYYYNGKTSYNHESWFGQYGKSWVKGRSTVGTTNSVNFYNYKRLKAIGKTRDSFMSQYLYMIISSSTGEVGDNSPIVLERTRPVYFGQDDYGDMRTIFEFTLDIPSVQSGYISFANTYDYGNSTDAQDQRMEVQKVWLEL